MDKLIHLIYVSTATQEMSQEQIYELFTKASLNNQTKEITGLLLHIDGSFLQILEGEQEKVTSLYQEITKDERHTHSKKVLFEEIEERGFANWSMGFAGVTREELRLIDGLNDFFVGGTVLQDLSEEKVLKVLSAFKEGRWREKIQ
ncbi:BLUF domain-containing protein [Vibrio sp. S4M6]|uniref:BLUF domain-containing protein n=1 Tax=Vibrio sinus TaxID=2946865 RepID=UPI002029EDCC|nr:BLUF domain-containing protein [Vibrio sinus]MCL9783595.1 BLUF domain-containing protein [Vibrio sinus]